MQMPCMLCYHIMDPAGGGAHIKLLVVIIFKIPASLCELDHYGLLKEDFESLHWPRLLTGTSKVHT